MSLAAPEEHYLAKLKELTALVLTPPLLPGGIASGATQEWIAQREGLWRELQALEQALSPFSGTLQARLRPYAQAVASSDRYYTALLSGASQRLSETFLQLRKKRHQLEGYRKQGDPFTSTYTWER